MKYAHNKSEYIEVEKIPRQKLSYEDFIHGYRKKRIPIIIENSISDWQISSYDFNLFKKQYGAQNISYRSKSGNKNGNLLKLIESLEKFSKENPCDYLRNIYIKEQIPQLYQNIKDNNLPYAFPNWKDSKLLPKNWLGLNKNLIELFIGTSGMVFPVLHIDYWGMDGLVTQVYGNKDFLLIPPSESDYLYQNSKNPLISDIDSPFDFEDTAYPNYQKAQKAIVQLNPGDTLYNPGWWHTAQMNSDSITIIQSIWHEDNWKDLKNEIARTQNNPLKKWLYLKYLNLIESIKQSKF